MDENRGLYPVMAQDGRLLVVVVQIDGSIRDRIPLVAP